VPQDIPSLIWGIVIGVVAVFLTGLGSAAGGDAWNLLKQKLHPPSPPPPPPLYVGVSFNDHSGISKLNQRLKSSGYQSNWVELHKTETQRQKGYNIQHYEGHEVRTRVQNEESIWMVKPPN